MKSREITAENMNNSLDIIERTMRDEIATYGDNATVALTMQLMTYLCASFLSAYAKIANMELKDVVDAHLIALNQTFEEINKNTSQATH